MVEIDPITLMERPEVIRLFFGGPSRSLAGAAGGEPLEAVAEDGVRIAGSVVPGRPDEPHVVFFPGEFDSAETVTALAGGLLELGFTFIVMDYRGTGRSGGAPSMQGLFPDARAFLQEVFSWREDQGRTGPVVPMGRSLGTGVALDAALGFQEDVLALVLESAFDKTVDFLLGYGLEDAAEALADHPDPFSNREKMSRFKPPVLFLHSHLDDIVGVKQIEWLVSESRSKATQFQIVPSDGREGLFRTGGELYFSTIKDYLFLRMGRRPRYVPRRLRGKGR